eukprot:15334113-Ditylum_brightwellii.AAC.1
MKSLRESTRSSSGLMPSFDDIFRIILRCGLDSFAVLDFELSFNDKRQTASISLANLECNSSLHSKTSSSNATFAVFMITSPVVDHSSAFCAQ